MVQWISSSAANTGPFEMTIWQTRSMNGRRARFTGAVLWAGRARTAESWQRGVKAAAGTCCRHLWRPRVVTGDSLSRQGNPAREATRSNDLRTHVAAEVTLLRGLPGQNLGEMTSGIHPS